MWTIRAAGNDDIETLNGIAFRSKAYWGYDAAFMQAAQALLTLTPLTLRLQPTFLAERDGQITGFYSLRPWESEPAADGALELDYLFIDPPCIGQGAGQKLFDHAVDVARNLGYLTLVIIADPNAEGFYTKMGASTFGQHISELDDWRFLPVMQIGLHRGVP